MRDKTGKPARDAQLIARILHATHKLPVQDARPMTDALYDASSLQQ